jgi:hypothetical protein
LYYGRLVDSTILVALSTIAAQQSSPADAMAQAVNHLLDYCVTHPNAILCYHASDMILKLHSDALYLSKAKAQSQARGHFFLGNKSSNNPKRNN